MLVLYYIIPVLYAYMGREGKKFLEKLVIRERGLAGGKVRG
jgi:hypothetical protein